VAICPLEQEVQRALFGMANQQLLDHISRVQATNILLSYAASLVRLRVSLSFLFHYFGSLGFPHN
jgi:hypothetical protein